MPPRTTQQSHRPRVSDRTMVGTSPPRSLQALRHGTKNAATDGPGSGATQRSRTEPHTGLDVRQLPLPAEREKYFLLTSPFIEPVQKKYESPQSTPVAAAQPHASGPSRTERWAMSAEARPDVVKAATRRLGVICSILSGRSLRNKSSKDMAFPHPQSRKDHYRKEDKPSCGGIVWKFLKRTINIAEYRNGKDEVNPAKNRGLEGMAGTTGLEPAASAVTGQRSNQLNYVP